MELQHYHIPFGYILQQYYLYFCCFHSIFIIILFIRSIITHLGHSLPSKLRHIMIYLSLIVTAYGAPCIKQTCKQIALNIPHFSSILPKTINYILHMRIIMLCRPHPTTHSPARDSFYQALVHKESWHYY